MAKFPTKNDLAEAVRDQMIDLLNQRLAEAVDMGLQAKQAHWNVKGPAFKALHDLFDDVHGEALEWIDLIAERAVQLGGVADGSLQTVARRTTLAEHSLSISDGPSHVTAVSTSLATFGKGVRAAIDIADKAGDADTADLFTEVSRSVDKMLWFVEAHAHADR